MWNIFFFKKALLKVSLHPLSDIYIRGAATHDYLMLGNIVSHGTWKQFPQQNSERHLEDVTRILCKYHNICLKRQKTTL